MRIELSTTPDENFMCSSSTRSTNEPRGTDEWSGKQLINTKVSPIIRIHIYIWNVCLLENFLLLPPLPSEGSVALCESHQWWWPDERPNEKDKKRLRKGSIEHTSCKALPFFCGGSKWIKTWIMSWGMAVSVLCSVCVSFSGLAVPILHLTK